MIQRKYICALMLILAVMVIFWEIPHVVANEEIQESMEQDLSQEKMPRPVRGHVLNILSEEEEITSTSGGDFTSTIQYIEVEITDGKHKGENIIVENMINDQYVYNIVVQDEDDVLLYLEEDDNSNILNGYISEIVRDKFLLYLVVAFLAGLIIIGGLKGLKAIITLLLTAFAVIKILLPMILKGYNPILVSVGICAAVISITLLIISGNNKKTLSAIIGTTGGVIVAGIAALVVGSMANLTGLGNEEAQMLMFLPQQIDFDFKGLLFAGIIIGALGAVMDVGMSIASAMNEIELANPDIKTKKLIASGMNVGRDIMGTMSNTLILAYAGGALHLMLLFSAYDISFVEIINQDRIASEVVRAFAGSIGLIFTIPLTAIVAGTLGRNDVKEDWLKQ